MSDQDDSGSFEDILTSEITQKDIRRHHEAQRRFSILRDYSEGKISAELAMGLVGVKRTRFFKLLEKMAGATTYRCLLLNKTGRKKGLTLDDPEILTLIEEMFVQHYPNYKSIAGVWKHCQVQADNRRIKRPSYHTVRAWINRIGEKKLYTLTHSTDQVKQRYKLKPGYKTTTRPLEWVQFDHTPVDLIMVDEEDRTVLLDRCYISVAIDLFSRVILGFYVSLLPPSAVSVAMLMESCVLPKTNFLKTLGLPENLMPFHGLPEVIHTDNAKEFVSDVFVLNAKSFDIKVLHRDVPEKHQGGHVESLIGKIMLNHVHALPGSTGSNTEERKHLESEKHAAIGINGLRQMLAYYIHSYHEMVHSEIGMTPAEAWKKGGKNIQVRTLAPSKYEKFKYSFYPEGKKPIVIKGIEMMRRFYSSPELRGRVGKKVVVKYDPYDLSSVYANLDGELVKIPCVRNQFNKSHDYETYRFYRHRVTRERDGTMTKDGAQSFGKMQKIKDQEVKLTRTAKRRKKKQSGEEDYRNQSKVNTSKKDGHNHIENESVNKQPANIKKQKNKSSKRPGSPYTVGSKSFLPEEELIDFTQLPTFYNANRS